MIYDVSTVERPHRYSYIRVLGPPLDRLSYTCSLSLFGTNNIEFRSRQIGLLEDVIVVEDFYVGIAKKIPVFLVTHVKD